MNFIAIYKFLINITSGAPVFGMFPWHDDMDIMAPLTGQFIGYLWISSQ